VRTIVCEQVVKSAIGIGDDKLLIDHHNTVVHRIKQMRTVFGQLVWVPYVRRSWLMDGRGIYIEKYDGDHEKQAGNPRAKQEQFARLVQKIQDGTLSHHGWSCYA
jgi:hypothetical protein